MPYVPMTPTERVAAELRRELTDLPSGYRLPSVRDLAARFAVSPTTVTRALATLRREGLLVSRQGYANFRA